MKEFINFGCFYQPPIRMETSVIGPAKPDRIMWFSMWFLASMITFGLAFFPMFYRSIERRNQHFKLQSEMEKRVMELSANKAGEQTIGGNQPLERNGELWTVSIILVIPAFVILYLLSADLMSHEKNQQDFLKRTLPEMEYQTQRISLGFYVLITVATLGFGGIYWLYKVVNFYNNHFREHRIIDYEVRSLTGAFSHGESM